MLQFLPLPTDQVRALQSGQADAHGQKPEVHVSDGKGAPCRHCLQNVPKGASMLILAHSPFPTPQPYAETGPIFLCASPCDAHSDVQEIPEILNNAPDYLIKGYSADHRIVYGTGQIVSKSNVVSTSQDILSKADVSYLHVRSARNNCYLLRIE